MHGTHGREALLRPWGLRATEGVWLLWQQLSSPLRWWVRHPGGQIRLYQLDYTAILYLSKSAVKPACAARSHQHRWHLYCHTQLWKQSPSVLCKKWRWGLANYYCLQYWITAECSSVTACTPYPCSNTGIFTLRHSLCQMCLYELHSAKYGICQDVFLAKEGEAKGSSKCFTFSFSQEEPVTWRRKDPVGKALFTHSCCCVKNRVAPKWTGLIVISWCPHLPLLPPAVICLPFGHVIDPLSRILWLPYFWAMGSTVPLATECWPKCFTDIIKDGFSLAELISKKERMKFSLRFSWVEGLKVGKQKQSLFVL